MTEPPTDLIVPSRFRGPATSGNGGWTAGWGTDGSRFFGVYNPTRLGRNFAPEGAYVRGWGPELADADDPHDPSPEAGRCGGYPEAFVDHAEVRREALDRWEWITR